MLVFSSTSTVTPNFYFINLMRSISSLIRTMLHRAYRLSSSWELVVRDATILKGCSLNWDTRIDWLMPPLPRFLTQSLWRKIKFRRTTPCRRETSFGSFYLSKIRDLRTSSKNSSKLLATTSAIQYKRYSRVQKLASNFEFRIIRELKHARF